MAEEHLDKGLNEMAKALASLQWKTSGIDRDRTMYLAGQASARRPQVGFRSSPTRFAWPLATAASILLAVTMGATLLLDDKPQTVERIVYVPASGSHESPVETRPGVSSPEEPTDSLPRSDYLVRRWIALTQGVDALPEIEDSASSPAEGVSPEQIYSRPADFDFNS